MDQARPYNSNFIVLTLQQIAGMGFFSHDQKLDSVYEEDMDEPVPNQPDRHIPHYTKVHSPQKLFLDECVSRGDLSDEVRSQRLSGRRRLTTPKRNLSRISLGVRRMGTGGTNSPLTSKESVIKRQTTTKKQQIEFPQKKLQAEPIDNFDDIDDPTKEMIEKLRQQTTKKNEIRRQLRNRKVTPSTMDVAMITTQNTNMELTQYDTKSNIGNSNNQQSQKKLHKLRIDRLPKILQDVVKPNLDTVPTSQETQFTKFLKLLQLQSAEERGYQYEPPINQTELDPSQLLMSSGLATKDLDYNWNKDFQMPMNKVINPNFGVTFKESSTVIEGESYLKKPKQATQYTKQQFLEFSNQIERKYLRKGERSLLRQLSRLQESKTQPHSPISNNQNGNVKFSQQNNPKIKTSTGFLSRPQSRSLIKLLSPTGQRLILGKDSNIYKQDRSFASNQILSMNQSALPNVTQFSGLMTPKLNNTSDFFASQELLKSELHSLMRQTYVSGTSQTSRDKIVKFQPVNQLHQITSMHDKLNNMMARHEDPEMIFREIQRTKKLGTSSGIVRPRVQDKERLKALS